MGGYYIGRYEAGISEGNERTAKNEIQTASEIENISGKAIVQENKNIYNYITKDQAKGLAERIYPGKSKLCSSYGWDTALNFMQRQTDDIVKNYPTNSIGGNSSTSNGIGQLAKTGYDKTHPCNIYGMGGNVFEFTTEDTSDANCPTVIRGGDYNITERGGIAADRGAALMMDAYDYFGFRVTLYV